MNLVSGYPFWLIKDGLPFNYPALDRSVKTDVLIIGAGISGALMAYHLMKAGVDCMIADRRTVGLGSTCASTSLLQYEIDVPLSRLIGMIGRKQAVQAYQLCGEAIKKIEHIDKDIRCGEFAIKQSLYYAAHKNHLGLLGQEFEARKNSGFHVSMLDTGLLNSYYGLQAPAAILSELAAQTNAYNFTHALLQYCIKRGVPVYDRTCIAEMEERPRSVVLTTDKGYRVRAKKIIHATGYEAVQYIDKKIVNLHTTYAAVSEQYPANTGSWKDEVLIWNTANPYLYARRTKDDRVIVGGRDEPVVKLGKNNQLIQSKAKLLKKDIEKILPGLDYKIEFGWSGIFGSTKDGLPYIGCLPGRPHTYFALGFGGNGITFSLIAAEMITAIITKGKDCNSGIFSFDRG